MSEQSDQATEDPTARRWEKAFEDGQVAFSTELVGGLLILVAVLFFLGAGKWFFDYLLNSLRERLTFFEPMVGNPDSMLIALRRNVEQVGLAVMGLLVPLSIVAIASSVLQTRFNLSSKPLEIKWSKVSPGSGLKRLFSTRAIARGALAIAKASVIILVSYYLTIGRINMINTSGIGSYERMIAIGAELLLAIGFVSAILMVLIGFGDLVFQMWKQKKDLMMTKQEIRDEHKDSDGDPQMKARIKKLFREITSQQVAVEVPKATVVITNPTHFAVALRYDPEKSAAPIVVAKGADDLAKHIIAIAKASGVAVVERKPVARFLYANVKVGGEIPFELYQAVAEILNYIRRTNRASRVA